MSEGAPISLVESVILGFVQGATEFLPISSSGHLVILQNLFGMQESQVLFDVMLHVGTLAAIMAVFRKDIGELLRAAGGIVAGRKPGTQSVDNMLAGIVVGCVPTALIGIAFSDAFERMFTSMTAAGIGLLITGLVLMSTVLRKKASGDAGPDSSHRIQFAHALLIGTAQGLAITPGISRSGATIAVALILGVERELAARFSFLLSIPAVLGALAFELRDYSPGAGSESVSIAVIFSGMVVAVFVGIVALRILLRIVKQGRISLFAYYCWAVGLLAITLGILKG